MKDKPEIDKASTAPTVKALSEESQTATKGTIVNNFTALTIAGTSVRQVNGLYSLNDLHKAAGKEEKNKPSGWMRNQQTQDLVAEISKAGIPAFETKRGNGAGIYACKELVIAYAAWISAAFHLKVIRVFLSVVVSQSKPVQASLDYDRISPAQAQDIKQIVQAIVDAGIQTYAETWARLQRKFKVHSYLALHPDQYEAVRAYLIGKLPNGYAGDVVESEPAATRVSLDDAVRLDLAFSMSAQAGAQVQRSVFAAVMKGGVDWETQRYVSNLTYDRMTHQLTAPATRAMDHGEMITTLDKLPDWINGGDPIFATDEQLANIATACTMRLSRSAAGRQPCIAS